MLVTLFASERGCRSYRRREAGTKLSFVARPAGFASRKVPSLGPLRPFGFALRAQATRRLRRGRISLGAFPLAHYDIIQTMKHALLASKSITLKAPQAKVRRIKAVIGNLA